MNGRKVDVFLYSKGSEENKKLLARACRMIEKTARRWYSNSTERRKSYAKFFQMAGTELNEIFAYISRTGNWDAVPKIPNIIPKKALKFIADRDDLFGLFRLAERATDFFVKHIKEECDQYHETIIDGYIEIDGEHLDCEVSIAEQDLFKTLGQVFSKNDQKTFDGIKLCDDWSVIDQQDRDDIYEKIYAIIHEDGLMILNRYIRAKTFYELKETVCEIEQKLTSPILYRFEQRLKWIYALFPMGEMSDAVFGEIE